MSEAEIKPVERDPIWRQWGGGGVQGGVLNEVAFATDLEGGTSFQVGRVTGSMCI